MRLSILLILFTFLILPPLNAKAMDEYEYDELLEKHLKSGHLTNSEVDEQKFDRINTKKYQQEFSRQVRGVASKLSGQKNVLKLVNQAIEISVK